MSFGGRQTFILACLECLLCARFRIYKFSVAAAYAPVNSVTNGGVTGSG